MRRRHVRGEPDRRDNLAAAMVSGVLAAGVGLVAFYFVRLFLTRDAMDPSNGTDESEAGDAGLSVE